MTTTPGAPSPASTESSPPPTAAAGSGEKPTPPAPTAAGTGSAELVPRAPVAPPPSLAPVPEGPGSLDAVASIASISVDGPLPDSEIRSAVDRMLGAFRDCYRQAAKQARRTPLLKIKVAFGIDESRAAQNLRVSGDTLGAGACIKDAASRLRTRVAPDVGTAGVSVVIKFSPVGG